MVLRRSSAPTTSEAFETITGWLVEDLRAAGRLDALYVDLHGAMVTDRYDDGDAEILRRLRDVVGPELPVVRPWTTTPTWAAT